MPTPDQARVLQALEGAGSKQAAAARLGWNRDKLNRWLSREGLQEQADALLGANPPPDVPVDDPQRLRIHQLEAQVKAIRAENGDYAKALASQEEFFQRIVDATRVPVAVPNYEAAEQDDSLPSNSVVAPIYDQQFGQFVRPGDTPGGRGEFSLDVFDRRLARWVDGITGIIRKRADGYRIRELLIPFGGDHVEGDDIFAGQPWQLELDPCRQVYELTVRMYEAIREVVRFAREDIGVEYIGLYGVEGNHGKVGGKKSGARPNTYNWDLLFLNMLFDRLRAEPIDEFAIESGGALFFVCAGHQFQMIHGDEVKGWGGLPFYGLTKFDGRSIRLHNTIYRYLLMGHHHQPAEIPNGAGETIVSGDWCGANNLSRFIQAASRPQQKVLFVSEKYGLCASERIYFTEASEAYAEPQVYGLKEAA